MRRARTPSQNSGNSLRLPDLLGRLSPRRQELIRPVLENPREYVLASVRALAEKLGIDPATASRVVHAMGFASYRDFQHYLHELSIAHATSFELMQTAGPSHSDVPGHLRACWNRDLKNLHALVRGSDFPRFTRLAGRIHRAQRILLLGGDLAVSLVVFTEYTLRILGLPVLSATSYGQAMHLCRSAGNRDLVLAISFRRGIRQTVEGLQLARAKGAYCVGITDSSVSPIARFAHEWFLASTESPSFGSSYVAPMALVNLILVACADYRRAATLKILREAEKEQRTSLRWYRNE